MEESIDPRAEELHQLGRQHGSAGEMEQAIACFREAAELAPAWPYPTYDLAFTYLLMGDAAIALTYYQAVVELAPRGFFTALEACDALSREAAGELPAGTYGAYMQLEWLEGDAKVSALETLLERVPRFAPALKARALMLEGEQRGTALEDALTANPDPETRGVLQLNLALHLQQSDRPRAQRLIQELLDDPTTTLANESIARNLLSSLASEDA